MDTNFDFMTVIEVAKAARVDVSAIHRAIKAKELIAYRPGKAFKIKKEDFVAWLNSKCTKREV